MACIVKSGAFISEGLLIVKQLVDMKHILERTRSISKKRLRDPSCTLMRMISAATKILC